MHLIHILKNGYVHCSSGVIYNGDIMAKEGVVTVSRVTIITPYFKRNGKLDLRALLIVELLSLIAYFNIFSFILYCTFAFYPFILFQLIP